VVVSSFDSLSSVIDGQLRWSGAGAGLIRETVAAVATRRGGVSLRDAHPVRWAADVRIPVLVAHGLEDTLIPASAGRRLFNAFPSERKEFVEVAAGSHDGVLITPMPLYAKMAGWFLTHLEPER
jgi:alpha-beta hydrolase superfamily lysophospholipase